jgi:hypothetical protein
LLHVLNPINYDDLKTVDGHLYNTFQEACKAHGILYDDWTSEETMHEAEEASYPPVQVHSIFAFLLVHCKITNPMNLWTDH